MKRFLFVLIPLFLIFSLIILFSSLPDTSYLASSFITPTTTSTPPSPTPTSIPTITIGLVGDLGLGRHITSTARSKNDFSWSLAHVSDWLQSNDYNFANLESPIITNCPKGETGTFTFCGDERFLPYLQQNKLVFTLANNHIFNYSQDGFSQTKAFLSDFQIPYVYSHQADTDFTLIQKNNIKIGIISYDFITNPNLDPQLIIDNIKKHDSEVDWLIVSLHWGNEYLPKPEAWRVNLAHQLVDAGADIIHGHHPHVWQANEMYQTKPIYYSLGNFIFDQSWSYETSHSNAVRLVLSPNKILSQEIFPYQIDYNSQPKFMELAPSASPTN